MDNLVGEDRADLARGHFARETLRQSDRGDLAASNRKRDGSPTQQSLGTRSTPAHAHNESRIW
jgi:hypothetical protein